MKKLCGILIIICLIAFALSLEATKNILTVLWNTCKPVGLGIFFALTLKPMVSFLESTVFSCSKLKKVRRGLSVTVTLATALGFFVLTGFLVAPELGSSFKMLKDGLESMDSGNMDIGVQIPDKVRETLGNLLKKAVEQIPEKIPSLIDKIGEFGTGVVNLLLGLMLAVTLLWHEEEVLRFFSKIAEKTFSARKTDLIKGGFFAVTEKFSKYLAGSILEALIFGTACYITFLIFKIPYALLLALIVGIFNLVPTVGGYIGGALGVLVILSASADKVWIFVIIMLVIQQIEQVTTYPIIVGKYVGLNPFFVLFAVVIGGGIFGFWGLVLGVPTMAFIYNLIEVLIALPKKEETKRQDEQKNAQ